MANALTLLRIISGILLIPFPAFSSPFFAFYVIGGISDILDGWIARRTGTVSRTGAMLDSAADAVFFLIAAIRILPAIPVPRPVWDHHRCNCSSQDLHDDSIKDAED